MSLKEKIKESPRLKHWILNLIVHPIKARPQWWIRVFQFVYLKKGKGSVIYRSVRQDLVPFQSFVLGKNSVVEDFSCLNNAVGEILIGDYSRIGLGNTIIGPVHIGNHVHLAQNITVSGLNHSYENISQYIHQQPVSKALITIEDDVWIGSNSIIVAGISIHKHSVIGAGSIVTKDVPAYCVAVGNPAQIIRKYNPDNKEWEKCLSSAKKDL